MRKIKPNKDVTRMIQTYEALKEHRSKEQMLIGQIQHLACKALNGFGSGNKLVTRALLDDAVYAVTVLDRGKARKGAPGRPRLRYKTEIKQAVQD